MRWPTPLRTAVGVALLSLAAVCPSVAADELPPGFTDGRPVGEELGGAAGTEAVVAATERYFGQEAYNAVRAAVTATSRPCTISTDGLTALVLAPVFKESSAATTPSTAPAPMTLSRYDEWSGTFGTTNNQDANYGLYAFRDPFTPYQRAYWHPGIGIWQYDSAGLGAPFTAIESMHVGVMAADVARIMSTRYCAASGTDQDRRYAAWTDWGFPCTLCEGFFDEMYNTVPKFANLNMVSGITALGGVVQHTCALQGVAGTRPCWYVDPRVGVIQGATAWATLSPDGGSGPTVPPAPLSRAFYVVDRGTTEERHWLRADTGYGIDIRATRTIGRNARPRSTQPGSGLTWASTSGLCDITASRGACVPVPPAGVTSKAISVASGYRPVSLDANGDGKGDVLWYRPGSGSDAIWLGAGAGSFASHPLSVSTTYDDVLTGDIDDDGDDDVLWYAHATGSAFLWRSKGDGTFTSVGLTPGSGRRPLLLDTDGNGDDEIFWYGPGSLSDSLWNWVGTNFSHSPRSVSGTFGPVVGDFDGNGREDILWYAAGSATDYLWLHSASGTVTSPRKIVGRYQPMVGDLDGDLRDDIVWYAPGSPGDNVWFGAPFGAFASKSISVKGYYYPFVADITGTGRDSVVWYAPGTGSDFLWSWSTGRVQTSSPLLLPGFHFPVVGGFSTGGTGGVLWYQAALPTDVIWYR